MQELCNNVQKDNTQENINLDNLFKDVENLNQGRQAIIEHKTVKTPALWQKIYKLPFAQRYQVIKKLHKAELVLFLTKHRYVLPVKNDAVFKLSNILKGLITEKAFDEIHTLIMVRSCIINRDFSKNLVKSNIKRNEIFFENLEEDFCMAILSCPFEDFVKNIENIFQKTETLQMGNKKGNTIILESLIKKDHALIKHYCNFFRLFETQDVVMADEANFMNLLIKYGDKETNFILNSFYCVDSLVYREQDIALQNLLNNVELQQNKDLNCNPFILYLKNVNMNAEERTNFVCSRLFDHRLVKKIVFNSDNHYNDDKIFDRTNEILDVLSFDNKNKKIVYTKIFFSVLKSAMFENVQRKSKKNFHFILADQKKSKKKTFLLPFYDKDEKKITLATFNEMNINQIKETIETSNAFGILDSFISKYDYTIDSCVYKNYDVAFLSLLSRTSIQEMSTHAIKLFRNNFYSTQDQQKIVYGDKKDIKSSFTELKLGSSPFLAPYCINSFKVAFETLKREPKIRKYSHLNIVWKNKIIESKYQRFFDIKKELLSEMN